MLSLKLICVMALRFLMKLFWLLPIDKRAIAFVSYGGSQYSDSPKYIFQALESDKRLKFIWILDDSAKLTYDGGADVKVVKPNSFSAAKAFLTSQVIVSNTYMSAYISFRKKQLYINTWHGGGAFKKVGKADEKESFYNLFFNALHASMVSVFVSSSKYFTSEVLVKSFGFHGRVLECGLPRNDALFQTNHDSIIRKVRERYGAPPEAGILLYAPTYRRERRENDELDFALCVRACEERFGKPFVCFYRSHYITGATDVGSKAVNVTDYDDMQELLIASDALITDYSSCMWDYFLTGKPVFLFTPDVDYYQANRGFYIDIAQWPCSYAKTNAALQSHIRGFDESAYRENVKKFLELTGSYERGNAVSAVCDCIYERLPQETTR